MKKKNIIFVIALIIILYFFVSFYKIVQDGIELNNLNNLYKDISILDDRIAVYFLNNGKLPIKGEKIEFDNSINPNDDNNFYEIDLSKLDNQFLIYGEKKFGKEDIYIINEQSHTIYYNKGIKYNNDVFFTKNVNYQKIDLESYK